METEFETAGGAVRIIDFMPIRKGASALVRIVVGLRGTVPMRCRLRLRFDYGALPPWSEAHGDDMVAKVGPDLVVLRAPVALTVDADDTSAEFEVTAGERLAFVLSYGAAHEPPPPPVDAEAALDETQAYWRDWIGQFRQRKTRWPAQIRRSLITLKAMIYAPTGGLVAAPTTSLPEAPGGTMNWDYRYCWLRDASFTLCALLNAGFHEEAAAWRDWLLRAVGGSPERLRIMYRVDGSRHLAEWTVGAAGLPLRAARCASATPRQRSTRSMSMASCSMRSTSPGAAASRAAGRRRSSGKRSSRISRGSGTPRARASGSRAREPRHYTYSKVMAWVGLDRFIRHHGKTPSAELERLSRLRQTIHDEVCREGWNGGLRTFTQYYGGQEVDASLLLLPLVGFLPADDPRMAATIARIERDLSEGGLIRRSKAKADGPNEGTFLACSCWMADCLNMQGRHREASAQLERVLAVANDLGLLAEEYNVPGKHLAGNFPQALTHLAVVNTALGLSGPTIQRGGG